MQIQYLHAATFYVTILSQALLSPIISFMILFSVRLLYHGSALLTLMIDPLDALESGSDECASNDEFDAHDEHALSALGDIDDLGSCNECALDALTPASDGSEAQVDDLDSGA